MRNRDPLLRDWRLDGAQGPGTCMECGKRATKQSCFPGEPWRPFCAQHDLPAYLEHNTRPYWRGPAQETER